MSTRKLDRKFQLFWNYCVLVISFSIVMPSVAQADIELTLVTNQPYYEDGDTFQLSLMIQNDDVQRDVDIYVILALDGHYYFYPTFSESIDFHSMTIPAGFSDTIDIIEPFVLPNDLPLVVMDVYAACTSSGTYDIVSNIDQAGLFLQSQWPVLPEPTYDNTFYFLCGGWQIGPDKDQSVFDSFAADLREHFPLKGPYMQVGIAVSDPVLVTNIPSNAVQMAEKAHEAGVPIGFHVGVSSHHLSGLMEAVRTEDRRNNQWEPDGRIFNSGPDDVTASTLSRYAEDIVEARRTLVEMTSEGFRQALSQFPETVVCMDGPIEVELRRAFNDDPHYADYSPFAIAEFRDWLLHRGIYDDDIGAFAGQGVFTSLIDDLDFSNDPSPAEHVGSGPSFNEYFGTDFTTWSLKYWDPDVYPDPLPLNADPLPGPGETGYIPGGFDAPREIDGVLTGGNDIFKGIWDGYYSPTGYGFRQMSVYHYVSDNSFWFMSSGVPKDRIFSHQIPADFLNNWIRLKGSASPFWTALTPYGNAGYTTFWDTAFDETLFALSRELSPNWGIFEYHPDPFMTHDVSYFAESLELVFRYRTHIVEPLQLYARQDGLYALLDTPFETAVRAFFSGSWPGTDHRRFDQPYFNETWIDYLPPPVTGIELAGNRLTWSDQLWPSKPDIHWSDWGEFDHFDIYAGSTPDFIPNQSNRIASTTDTTALVPLANNFKVLAVSKSGLTSPFR